MEDGKTVCIKEKDTEFTFECVSMGNPHAITLVNNVEKFDVEKYGPGLETNKIFPERANIEFVEIVDNKTIKMRVWERGTGETLACGTGACASVIACNIMGKTQKEVTVKLKRWRIKNLLG